MNGGEKEVLKAFQETLYRKGLGQKTVQRKIETIQDFGTSLEKETLFTATADDVSGFISRYEDRYSASSINMKICALQEFYLFLLDEGTTCVDPSRRLKRYKVGRGSNPGVFTEDEVRRIFAVIPDTETGIRNRAIFELFYSCGLRASELIGLDIGDIDFRERECMVRHGKGATERIVPIGYRAVLSLERYLSGRETVSADEPLFLSGKGNRVNDTALRQSLCWLKDRAGVTAKGSLHALRHSCATHMLQRGAPIAMVQQLLGHAYLDSTERYTHPTEGDLKDVYSSSHPTAQGGGI